MTPWLFTYALLLLPAQDPTPDYAKPGPHKVATLSMEWKDAKRNDRVVPVKIYQPEKGDGPFPVLIFSHGLGGSCEGYEYLGRHWASHGYVCVHLQHKGSDADVWKGAKDIMKALKDAAADPANSVNRTLDVAFALDELTRLTQEDVRLRGRLDLNKVGMAGHSFGAWTTLAVIGQVFFPKGKEMSGTEPRIKAAVAMSASVPPDRKLFDKSFGGIKVPCLHLTGTKDTSPVNPDLKAEDRRVPYDHIKLADQYLAVFKDGDHMVFAGKASPSDTDKLIVEHVKASSTAFWDAYLKGDAKARAFLRDGAFKRTLGDGGSWEFKAPK
jgi:predicted dienelactone hydrolase